MSVGLPAWLEEQLATAPPSLMAVIRQALDGMPGSARDLDDAAERLMREARTTSRDREGALTLLAADALTTLAHEWRARVGTDAAPRSRSTGRAG